MKKRIISAVIAITLMSIICTNSMAAVYSGITEWTEYNLADGVNLIYDGTFDTTDTAHLKFGSNTDGVVSTGDAEYGNAVKVTTGNYFCEQRFLPNQTSSTNTTNRKTLENAIERGAKLRVEFEIKPSTTLTGLRVQFRNGSTDLGNSKIVPDKCFVDGVKKSDIFTINKTNGAYTGLSLAANAWHTVSLYYDFSDKTTQITDNNYMWLYINPTCTNGYVYIDNISVHTTDVAPEATGGVSLSSGVTAATEEEISELGELPSNIGTIYKYTATLTSASQDFTLLTMDKDLWGGSYKAKIDFYEPLREDAEGTSDAVTRAFRTASSSNADLLGYRSGGVRYNRGVWNSVSNAISVTAQETIATSNTDFNFKWNTIDNAQGFGSLSAEEKTDCIIYFSIQVYRDLADDVFTFNRQKWVWNGTSIFDWDTCSSEKFDNGAVIVNDTLKTVTLQDNGGDYKGYFNKRLSALFSEGAIVKIKFKAKGDVGHEYDQDAAVQIRTGSAQECTVLIPNEDLATGEWNEYTATLDMSNIERNYTVIRNDTPIEYDRTNIPWWIYLRAAVSGTQTEGSNVYIDDIDVQYAVVTDGVADYISATYQYTNNGSRSTTPDVMFFFAEYEDDEHLLTKLNASINSETVNAQKVGKVHRDGAETSTGKNYKAFLWNSEFKPLASVLTY